MQCRPGPEDCLIGLPLNVRCCASLGRKFDETAPEWSIFLSVGTHHFTVDFTSEYLRDPWLRSWVNGAPLRAVTNELRPFMDDDMAAAIHAAGPAVKVR